MKMFRRKNHPYQPSRQKLDLAISAILDQAINIDSEKAPQQLRIVLLKENPMWKLPQRRVARYLKRHLRARQSPDAENIEADMDEETVYTTLSTQSNHTLSKEEGKTEIPLPNNGSIPEDDVNADANTNENTNAPREGTGEPISSNDGVNTEGTEDNTDDETDNKVDEQQSAQKDTITKDGEESNTNANVDGAGAGDQLVVQDTITDNDVMDIEITTNTKTLPIEEINQDKEVGLSNVKDAYADDNDVAKPEDICSVCVIS
jgi:hypothetical protein